MKKTDRLLQSFNSIDEKYITESQPKVRASKSPVGRLLACAACFVLVIALSAYLFIPLGNQSPNVTAYEDSEYYPLIATIENYRFIKPAYKNNFQRITTSVAELFALKYGAAAPNDSIGSSGGAMASPELGANKNDGYVEVTDNQVEGVIEGDLMKRTGTHIFRLGNGILRVYTINGADSTEIATFYIPKFDDEKSRSWSNSEMYLSADGNTVTVVGSYYNEEYEKKIGITSIDVSVPGWIEVKKQISVDGEYTSSRVVNGKLLLVGKYSINTRMIDYDDPQTYVPTVTVNQTTECIKFDNIIYPEKLTNMSYSTVTLMDENSLDIIGANALLCYNGPIYVSHDNVYVTRSYNKTGQIGDDEESTYTMRMTDIAVIGYADNTLEKKGALTVEGTLKDQYSMDEFEGYFRVVTSTRETLSAQTSASSYDIAKLLGEKRRSASLTVFDLDSFSKAAEVKDFAPEGEEATAVRFDGSTAYVCTAVVVDFTDPVYAFDLSDYANITYSDTGTISGFSTSLIQFGDGFLLGIGSENGLYNKVEVYEAVGDEVLSVDDYLFEGSYSQEYKSYYIDRENNLLGFGVNYFYYDKIKSNIDAYVLLKFDGNKIIEVKVIEINPKISLIRSFMDDGFLYITDDTSLKVVSIAELNE